MAVLEREGEEREREREGDEHINSVVSTLIIIFVLQDGLFIQVDVSW